MDPRSPATLERVLLNVCCCIQAVVVVGVSLQVEADQGKKATLKTRFFLLAWFMRDFECLDAVWQIRLGKAKQA